MMTEKEMAVYLFQTLQYGQMKTYSEWIKMGKETIETLKRLSDTQGVDEDNKEKLAQINSLLTENLAVQLSLIKDANSEQRIFIDYLNSLSSPLDKEILTLRYLYGYKWKDIIPSKDKGESTIMRHHKDCILQYIKWREKYVGSDGAKKL